PCWPFKVKVRPALGLPCPQQGFTTHLIASDPVERFFLYIGMLFIFYKEMCGIFMKSITLADNRVLLFHFIRHLIAMFKLPGHHICRWIILNMLHITSTFQYQGLESFLTQFLCGPATTNSRTDHYRVI